MVMVDAGLVAPELAAEVFVPVAAVVPEVTVEAGLVVVVLGPVAVV